MKLVRWKWIGDMTFDQIERYNIKLWFKGRLVKRLLI